MTSTAAQFTTHPALAAAAGWSPEDATLSSSERSLAVVVAALVAEFDGLDGAQQRAVVEVLEKITRGTEAAELAGRRLLEAWAAGRP